MYFTLLCLCSLVEDCPQGLRDCRDPALGLEELLKQRSIELCGKEENEVSLELDAEMLKLVTVWWRNSQDPFINQEYVWNTYIY